MTERRYNEAEVAAIFKRATEAQPRNQQVLPAAEGMTLAQLQEIGREVGIAPDAVQEAARAIELVGRPMSRYFLGLPIGVGRTVNLDRKLSDEEWERFVVDLRETFDARGRLKSEGSFRQWTNGNLQALLEPTPTGQQVRLRTVKGAALSMLVGGIGMMVVATGMVVEAAAKGTIGDPGLTSSLTLLIASGLGIFGVAALRLRSWARERRRQMEEIAARIAAIASSTPRRERE